MHLAVPPDRLTIRRDEDGGVETLAASVPLGIAKIEADAQLQRAIEQRLHTRVRHFWLEILVQLRLGLDQPAWEECREREFGKHDKTGTRCRGLLQQGDQAPQSLTAGITSLCWSHLRGGAADHARGRHFAGPMPVIAAEISNFRNIEARVLGTLQVIGLRFR